MKNYYLAANPQIWSKRKDDNPNYTKEQIYNTLNDEDNYPAVPVGIILEQAMAQVKQLELGRTRTGNPGDDSSDNFLDDEDTGETSGQELDFKREERKSKLEKGKKSTE